MEKTTTTESEFQAILFSLENKTAETLATYVEASEKFQEAHGKWEKIKDSLRNQGCKI